VATPAQDEVRIEHPLIPVRNRRRYLNHEVTPCRIWSDGQLQAATFGLRRMLTTFCSFRYEVMKITPSRAMKFIATTCGNPCLSRVARAAFLASRRNVVCSSGVSWISSRLFFFFGPVCAPCPFAAAQAGLFLFLVLSAVRYYWKFDLRSPSAVFTFCAIFFRFARHDRSAEEANRLAYARKFPFGSVRDGPSHTRAAAC